ncbi:NADPH:quinone oxidoreductase [Serinibacter arcticus]|uniref:NADPH:quinone oxidoreductase n=1 Tax=Serinibacter arcticus TaxID=1655435 RepID=A0A2U1ZTF0_9MICO|nr:NADP-dependent oxidoreductase [Serinibacter arcticus]PWD50241.1 NADPH:quinone oxidoreductase [Serinibacter arcticus]
MKGWLIDRYGTAPRLAEVPEPTLGAHDVLVEVRAAGVNQLDVKIAAGEFKQLLPYDLPLVLGHDVAGVVVAVGADARRFAIGETVFARPRDGRIGTFAERIAVHEDDVATAPPSIGVDVAAGLPLVGLTAWQALVERGAVTPGQKVLIHGGAGGVGQVAIQLAKHLGARVATTVSAKDADLVRELGADVVIDYRTERFEELLSDYGLALDSLGGENLDRTLRVLRPGGLAIGISGPPTPAFARSAGLNPVLRGAITLLSRKVRRRATALGVRYEFLFMHASGAQLERVAALVTDGTLRPPSVTPFAFDEATDALTALASGAVRGKAVLVRPEV